MTKKRFPLPQLFILNLFLLSLLQGATHTVTTLVDEDDGDLLPASGAGNGISLREAIVHSSSTDTVIFDAALDGGTITLGSSQLTINKALTIDASTLPNGLTIARDLANPLEFRIFTVNDSTAALIPVTLTNLTLTGGYLSGVGGGIRNLENLTLSDCHLTGNRSGSNGGGLYNNSGASGTLTNCTFTGNNANQSGGGLYLKSSTLQFSNCQILSNIASFWGGGVYNDDSSPSFENCELSGNTANDDGGGLYNYQSSPTLTNCLFQGNFAQASGGGLYNNDSSAPNLINCTFQGNNVNNSGGGIFNEFSSPSLSNCLIWSNSANGNSTFATASVHNVSGSSPTYEYCLIRRWADGTLNDLGGTTNLDGTAGSNNPLFVNPLDPATAPFTGGDLSLQVGSPALDSGLNSANSASLDLAGRPRKIGVIDLGAYERVSALIVTNLNDSGPGSLRQTLLDLDPDGTITFDPSLDGGSITLESAITLVQPVNIDASSLSGGLTLARDLANPSKFRLVLCNDIDSATKLEISLTGLTLTGGSHVGSGGAISNYENLALTDCHFLNNEATLNGGAIINRANAIGTYLKCSFIDNSTGINGGGMFITSSSPTLTNCVFHGNNASGNGGGIQFRNSSPILTNCTFSGNTSVNGAGVYADTSPFSSSLTNCSFQGNHASSNGGGLYIISSSTTLTNCTIQGNKASSIGGGIYNFSSSSPALTNSIIWNNCDNSGTGTSNSAVFNLSSTPTYTHCLIQSLNPSGTGNLDGTLSSNAPLFILPTDPLTAPTTTGDSHLRILSPAIDSGEDSANTHPVDLDGNSRIIDGDSNGSATIDLGAFEKLQPLKVVNLNDSGAGSLRQAITDAAPEDSILFDASLDGGTITLTSSLAINKALTVDATPLANGLTLARDPSNPIHFRLLVCNDGIGNTKLPVSLNNLTFTGGSDSNEGGALANNENLTLTNCHFSNNHATNEGGALINRVDAICSLTDCSFTGNSSNAGGAVYNRSSSLTTLTNCSFKLNTAANNGGGIYNTSSSSSLINCSFQLNTATNSGGGIISSYSTTTLTNCSFSGNQSDYGGGLIDSYSSLTLINCSLHGNKANSDGGGLLLDDCITQLINCTIQGNDADGDGGGIYDYASSPHLANCLIWNNASSSSTNIAQASMINLGGSSPSYEHCLIHNWSDGGTNDLGGTTNLDGTLAGNDPLFLLPVDPLTAPSIAGDLRLQGRSPVIDAGDNAANSEALDLAGNVRLVDGNQDSTVTIDLGAFEVPLAQIVLNNADTGDGSLRQALALTAPGGMVTFDPSLGGATITLESSLAINTALTVDASPLSSGVTLARDLGNLSHFRILNLDDGDSGTKIQISLSHLTITGGSATLGGGASSAEGAGINNHEDLSASHCHLINNTATDAGGGLSNRTGSICHLIECSFQNNSAGTSGGGIFNIGNSTTLTDCSFTNNSAVDQGGGLYSLSSCTLTNCSFRENITLAPVSAFNDSGGGGIFLWNTIATLINCSFQGNHAQSHGGGLFNKSSNPSLINCTFQGNKGGNGGGIYNESSNPSLINCTLHGNHGNVGGGIFNSASAPSLTNCLIWNNASGNDLSTHHASVRNLNSSTPSYAYCLIQHWADGASHNLNGTTNLNGTLGYPASFLFIQPINPLSAPSTTGDLRLRSGSPALNVGDDTANSETSDLAGNPRKVSTIDLGAYEGSFVTFALEGFTNPTSDDNLNGISNFLDYATGGDPTAPDNAALRSSIDENGYTFSYRNNAVDLSFGFQKSATLLSGSWEDMVEGVDYNITSSTENGSQTIISLELLSTDDNHFVRGIFTTP